MGNRFKDECICVECNRMFACYRGTNMCPYCGVEMSRIAATERLLDFLKR
jgi:Zn finger protein HypA/HybF involved in hydrogenase expression